MSLDRRPVPDSVRWRTHHIPIYPGDHICALYDSASERNTALLPYLRDGLDAGHKCIGALGEHDHTPTLHALAEATCSDVELAIYDRQLVLRGWHNPILTSVRLDVDGLTTFWDTRVRGALRDGYPFVRLCLEAVWWLPQVAVPASLVDCEMNLDRFAVTRDLAVLCLYDLSHFSDETVTAILRHHRHTIINGCLFDNPCYRSQPTAAVPVEPPGQRDH